MAHQSFRRHAVTVVLISAATAVLATAGPPALEAPTEAAVAEGRRLVAAMQAADRGPYSRLRWFCADGSVLPPQPYACRDRGGGHQHGEYSAERQRLAELGWPVGTILTATPWEELWDGSRRNLRLRQLLVERYLVEVDDGWVLRRARTYRGRIQVEDEEAAGHDFLVALLARPEWVADDFLLAREAVRALPHHGGSDRTQALRRLSQAMAEKERGFEPLRIKIHSSPSAADREAVAGWLAAAHLRGVAAEVLALGDELLVELDRLYGGGDWLTSPAKALARDPAWPRLRENLAGLAGREPMDRLANLADTLAEIRDLVVASSSGQRNLALLDLSLIVERELNREAFALLHGGGSSRGDLLTVARHLVDGVYGCGLLSARERDAVARPLRRLEAGSSAGAGSYAAAVQGLRRVAGWCLGTVRHTFAEAVVGYGALEAKAHRFPDDVLRGSSLLPLAEVVTSLAADADLVQGVSHRLFGQRLGGLVGLNPGVARGRLRLVTVAELEAGAPLERSEIVVLPRTVSELTPVAGILTLAEGNLLSHVQLLARNLGIPNASLSPTLKEALREHAGREVLFAVAGDGSVVVEALAAVPTAVLETLERRPTGGPATAVDPPRPDLSVRRPIPLEELSAGLAGSVVGPKAANLGELARTFPGRVEAAIALPFGIFADHLSRGPEPIKARLDAAYQRHRAGELDAAGLATELAAVYDSVAALELVPELREQLQAVMATSFGTDARGVFIRSDTNVEDLPGFTGAGLNETLPNVVGFPAVARGIARVWASPFRERAVAWRAPLLTRPEEVYTSVLLMKSVPADKSGVMVTTDLVRRRPGLTVATSWGVGGAVDGDAAETVVLGEDGGVLLVGEAKAPYRRRLRPEGGVEWIPARAGRVLADDEQAALRSLAREVAERLEPALDGAGRPLPWDIEFGFVAGRLQLFQIRPLVERGSAVADRIAAALVPSVAAAPGLVDLRQPVPPRHVPMEAVAR